MKELNSCILRQVVYDDVYHGLLECLDNLSSSVLDKENAMRMLKVREILSIKTIVLVHEEKVVGTASYFLEPKLFHDGLCVCHIEDVVVHKDWAGLGVGKKLIEYILDNSKDFCYKAILDCKEDIAGFYEKIGFHKQEIQMRLDYGKKDS